MRTLVMIGAVDLVIGALILSTAGPVRADDGLTDAVAGAYFLRTTDGGLHAIAHERAAELAACECLEHDGIRPGTAEVLAWNNGGVGAAANAVEQWTHSPIHDGILSNASYGRIGCAVAVGGGAQWYACVLAAGPLPAASAAPPGVAIPDTALSGHAPSRVPRLAWAAI